MAGRHRLVGKVLDIAEKMLIDTTKIFEKNKIEYVLEAGTLLGIVRENRLLPWDNDIDVTVTEEFEKKLLSLKWSFILRGYRFTVKRYKKDSGPFKKGTVRIIKITTRKFLFFKGYQLLDIFIKRPIENEYFWTVSVKNMVLKSTPKHFYDERTTLKYNDKIYSVPKDSEGYLAYHYGENWRTPIKEWNFRTDDNCKQVKL